MGGWDYYCLICAAGFHVPYEVENGEDSEDSDEDDTEHDGLQNKLQPKSLFPTETVVSRLQWLSTFRTIGQNRNATGLTQCYLTGSAEENDYGQAKIQRGDHPNAQNLTHDYVNCYRSGDEESGDLPIHDSCFAILCKVFAHAQGVDYDWTPDRTSRKLPFELDALFSCLASVRGDHHAYCHLDHKLQMEQYFEVEWSQIYHYFDPLGRPEMTEFAVGLVDADEIEAAREKYTGDVFDALPHELLTTILDFTTQADLVPLISASRTFRRATEPSSFWQHRLRLDAPWLWEYRDNATDTPRRNWHERYNSVMMQANKPLETAAKGMTVSGLANCKRIWHVGEQILLLYLETNTLEPRQEQTSAFEEGVICQYLPIVANQQNPKFKDDTAFCFNSQSEIHSAKRLKLKWTENGALSGISLITAARKTTFGNMDGSQGSESVLDIQADDWIEKLVLNIATVKSWKTSTHYGEKSHRQLAVTGMAVWQLSHGMTILGSDSGYKRLLRPLPGNGIVGLKCQFAEEKVTHLGILEHPAGLTKFRAGNDNIRCDLLWGDHLPAADLRFNDYYTGYWMSRTGWDLVPMQTLIFGATDLEQSTMSGFGASSDLRCLEIYRLNGSCERVGLREGPMKIFHIDGSGGERIAGFEMTIGALPVGLTLVTTYGRQAVFGKRADNARHGHTSERGFGVAGIYCSFEYHSIPEHQLSSLGLIQSPHIDRPPMDDDRLVDLNGLVWEPQPPPPSWHPIGRVYGQGHQGEVVVCIDFSRPVSKIEGLFPAPEWLANIEVGGFTISYGDGDKLDPLSHFGFLPKQWPTGPDATPENLRKMQRYPGMATSSGRDLDTGEAHVSTDEEALEQPMTWDLVQPGEKIKAVTVWTGDYLNGLQFHSESGKDSPRWGKCGGQASGMICAGGEERVAGVKVILGSTRLGYSAKTLAPQAVQAMSDSLQ